MKKIERKKETKEVKETKEIKETPKKYRVDGYKSSDLSSRYTDNFRCGSMDIGSVNLLLYIEDFDKTELEEMTIPIKKRYKGDWTPNDWFEEQLDQVYKNGTEILLEKIEIKNKDKKDTPKNTLGNPLLSVNKEQQMYINCSQYLSDRADYIKTCKGFIIEAQLKKNPAAQNIAQHCRSHMAIHHPDIPVYMFPSSFKTKVLGMEKYEKGMTAAQKKKFRKEWAIQKAIDILKRRVEEKEEKKDADDDTVVHISKSTALGVLLGAKKQDDYADGIIQLQACKIKAFIDKNMNTK